VPHNESPSFGLIPISLLSWIKGINGLDERFFTTDSSALHSAWSVSFCFGLIFGVAARAFSKYIITTNNVGVADPQSVII
jgi:hypothetical protein